jgi:dihydrofolate reductase
MIGLIWAQAPNGVIGVDGKIPWRLPEDQANFKALTLDATVLMGRLTWESLPPKVRPLPGRRNLVLTRSPDFAADGAERVESVENALSIADTDVWVIGGEQVYAAALPLADQLVVTDVEITVEGLSSAIAFAPAIGPDWTPDADATWQRSRSGLDYRITTYRRTPNPRAPRSTGRVPRSAT